MPVAGRPEETGDERTERRLAALERAVGALATEVRTRRLVVADGGGEPRIVGELSRGTAELRVEIPAGAADGSGAPVGRSAVVLFASPPAGDPDPGRSGLEPAVGLQIWADGDAVTEIDAWPDDDGRWQSHLHLAEGDAPA